MEKKKGGSTHQQRQLTTVCVGVFFTKIFHLLVGETNLYYQQHLDKAS